MAGAIIGTTPSKDWADNKNQPTQEQGKWYNKGYSTGHKDGWDAGALDAQKKQVTSALKRVVEGVREVKQNNGQVSNDYLTRIEGLILEARDMIQRTY